MAREKIKCLLCDEMIEIAAWHVNMKRTWDWTNEKCLASVLYHETFNCPNHDSHKELPFIKIELKRV